jgi:hypothetical protein
MTQTMHAHVNKLIIKKAKRKTFKKRSEYTNFNWQKPLWEGD